MNGYGTEKSRASIRLGIHNWEVRGWPDRPFLASKIYSVGQWKFAINSQGHIFSNHVRSGRHFYDALNQGHALSIMRGLQMLGVVKDKGIIARLIEAEEARKKRRDAAYAARNALAYSDRKLLPGFKLTAAQITYLKKIIRADRK